ncbi:hypothetical protein [Bradymonas sediminis]|uniref:hypothetical protein n=1 Tax=Bradymonas sediminis TaxID=1548548 RepID=UPI0010ECDD09|nr:hypothetical protein [Bradymonas sediminis]TDP73843.1 hypothetical protein DFR33_105175 [Bradymonas sediminis]
MRVTRSLREWLRLTSVLMCATLVACSGDSDNSTDCPMGQERKSGVCVPELDASDPDATDSDASDSDASDSDASDSDASDSDASDSDASDSDASDSDASDSDASDSDASDSNTGCTDAAANNYDADATVDDGTCTFDVAFRVDTNCPDSPLTPPVAISGPFCEWCDTGFDLTDDDNDGIWEGTFSFAPGQLMFKYVAGGFQTEENIIGDGSCAVITDGATFANRQITIEGPTRLTHTWGQCVACGEAPLLPVDLPITFDDATIDYNIAAFGRAEAAISPDPAGGTNSVLSSTKPDGASALSGVILGQTPGLASAIPFVEGRRKLNLRVHAPVAGTLVRLKVEDAYDATRHVQAEATVTQANTWETLTFDFDNEVPGTDPFNESYAYNKISVFPAFGTSGADDGDAVYYIDDVRFGSGGGTGAPGCTDPGASNFDPAAGVDDDSCTYAVTFRVDLGCSGVTIGSSVSISGPFCNWCNTGYELADDDGDDVWEGTFTFGAGPLDYLYTADGYTVEESVPANGACAAGVAGSSVYRQLNITAPMITNDTWSQCSACGP